MFGRRKVPFGASSPAPPSGKEPFPIEKMDSALDGAIRLFTRALESAGVDCGDLAIRGQVPPNVTRSLAECTTYRSDDKGGLTYLVLGLTRDFEAFMYPPHCSLYLIINSTGICEDPHMQSLLDQLAPAQLPGPMVDAHLMRRWIRFILPTGEALAQGPSALGAIHRQVREEILDVLNRLPPAFARQIDQTAKLENWTAGLPGTIGRPLSADVQRMNGLPVTPFIAETLTRYLAEIQMRGLSERSM